MNVPYTIKHNIENGSHIYTTINNKNVIIKEYYDRYDVLIDNEIKSVVCPILVIVNHIFPQENSIISIKLFHDWVFRNCYEAEFLRSECKYRSFCFDTDNFIYFKKAKELYDYIFKFRNDKFEHLGLMELLYILNIDYTVEEDKITINTNIGQRAKITIFYHKSQTTIDYEFKLSNKKESEWLDSNDKDIKILRHILRKLKLDKYRNLSWIKREITV